MFINAETINSAWKRILEVVWCSPEFGSERGKTKEVFNLLVKIRTPLKGMICEGFPMGKNELESYSKQLLDPDKKGFEYTYGERLRKWGDEGIDQLGFIIKRLKKNEGSRRATAVTWIPPIDERNEEVPCLIMVDFKIREKKLNLTAVFRSNDMFGAWPANAYGLTRLCEYVAKGANVGVGTITTLSISAHIYEHDWKNVKRVLGAK
ncbi:MAG: thymidylate synthase [Candidatus Altiarchaeota archaeon]|nr:thymidylate synthase [Candidatus Altiarchaeota archaeon]